MSDEREPERPNEFGFAGGATAPQPDRGNAPDRTGGEDVAVPAGDLTGAVTAAVEEATDRDDADR